MRSLLIDLAEYYCTCISLYDNICSFVSTKRNGAEEAHWAHNPRVGGSKLPSATLCFVETLPAGEPGTAPFRESWEHRPWNVHSENHGNIDPETCWCTAHTENHGNIDPETCWCTVKTIFFYNITNNPALTFDHWRKGPDTPNLINKSNDEYKRSLLDQIAHPRRRSPITGIRPLQNSFRCDRSFQLFYISWDTTRTTFCSAIWWFFVSVHNPDKLILVSLRDKISM